MAASYPDRRIVALLVCAIAAAGAQAQDVPIELDAASTNYDRRNERLLFEQVSIERGTLGISAQRADSSQLDFADSTWVFRGDVRIHSEDSEVLADTATLEFVDHQLNRATITGAPAVLSHSGDASIRVDASKAVVLFGDDDLDRITLDGEPAQFEHSVREEQETVVTRGEAGQLIYDLGADQIRLLGDAWVSQGENEIRGEEIAYDIAAQRVVAGGQTNGERVRITITPPPESDSEDGGTQ